jgi:hypothetical protein
LDALEVYLKAYNIALKNKSFKRIYIDAFAGSALSKVREPILSKVPTFFDDPEDAAAQAEFMQGFSSASSECQSRLPRIIHHR